MSTAADMFAQSLVDMMRSEKDLRDAEAFERVVKQWQQVTEHEKDLRSQAELANAGNLAEKYALRRELARYAPQSPLLKNTMLLERLRSRAKQAFAVNRNYDDARAIGDKPLSDFT